MGELVDRDVEHLRLLHIAFYTMAGMSAFFSLFTMMYMAIGGVIVSGILSGIASTTNNIPPQIGQLGWIFGVIGFFLLAIGVGITVLLFLAGKNLQQRRHRVFCLVMAGLCCLQIPWGTVIGICAINVLNRPSVIALFDGPSVPPVPPWR